MSVFDGMGAVLNGVLGASVEVTPPSSAPYVVRGIFRQDREFLEDDEARQVLVAVPTLELHRADAAAVPGSSFVRPGNGKQYRILNRHDKGNPDRDGFVLFELELAE